VPYAWRATAARLGITPLGHGVAIVLATVHLPVSCRPSLLFIIAALRCIFTIHHYALFSRHLLTSRCYHVSAIIFVTPFAPLCLSRYDCMMRWRVAAHCLSMPLCGDEDMLRYARYTTHRRAARRSRRHMSRFIRPCYRCHYAALRCSACACVDLRLPSRRAHATPAAS